MRLGSWASGRFPFAARNRSELRYGVFDVPGITVGGTAIPTCVPKNRKRLSLASTPAFSMNGSAWKSRTTTRERMTFCSHSASTLVRSHTTQFQNLGSVSNKGWEFVMNSAFSTWSASASTSPSRAPPTTNKLLTLGKLPTDSPVHRSSVNTQQLHKVGFPLGSYFPARLHV